jgi:hypothetical protein
MKVGARRGGEHKKRQQGKRRDAHESNGPEPVGMLAGGRHPTARLWRYCVGKPLIIAMQQ